MIKKGVLIVISWLLLTSLNLIYSLDFHVTAGSSPGNPGTLALPFASLPEAVTAVSNAIASGNTENITVFIGGGSYELDAPLSFTSSHSGTARFSVTFKNRTADLPVIIRGSRLTGWTLFTGMIYRVPAGSLNCNILYENNRGSHRRNTIAALTEPGTFCLSGSFIYYYPRHTPIADQIIIAPLAGPLLQLQGDTPAAPLSRLIFEGLVLSATDYNPGANGQPGNESALLFMQNCSGITITGCQILNAGNTAILLNKNVTQATITNNRIDGFGIHGISLCGLVPGDPGYADPAVSYVNKGHSITDNLICNGGGLADGSAALSLFQSGENRITRNCLTRINGTGIRLDGLKPPEHTGDNTFSQNRIFRITADTDRAAGIYLDNTGENNSIEGNLIYQLTNYTTGCAIAGIFVAEHSGATRIASNIIYNVHDIPGRAIPLMISGNHTVITNNVIADNDPFHDIVYHNPAGQAGNLELSHNIFYTPAGRYYHYFMERGLPLNFTSNHNIVYHPGGDYFINLPPARIAFNYWQGNTGQDDLSVVRIDPLFREPASGLYKVRERSPALWDDFENIALQTAGPGAGFHFSHATDRIEAEKYGLAEGILSNDTYVQPRADYNYLGYPALHFPLHINYLTIRYAADISAGMDTNVVLDIREGTPAGPLLGRLRLTGTGGSAAYRIVSLPVSSAPGSRTIYFIFTGNNANHIKLDWFEFSSEQVIEPPLPDQPPYVEIISPADGLRLTAGNTIGIEVRASDADGYISGIELAINGLAVSDTTGDELNYTWQNPRPGSYLITATATDSQELKATAEITLQVGVPSNQGPEVRILQPANNARFAGPAQIRVTAEAGDTLYDIALVEFYFNGLLLYFNTAPPYEYLWQNVQPGEYLISVEAENGAGYKSSSEISILVDNSHYVIGHWPLDDYHGQTAQDISGNDHNGTIRNAYPVNGINAGALDFTGGGAVITDAPLLNYLSQFTMAGWIKPRGFGNRIGLWGQDGVIEFGFNGRNVLHLWTAGGGGIDVLYPYALDEWHHITVSGDGYRLRVFLDGTFVREINFATLTYGSSFSSFNIGGGGIFDAEGNFFDGLIDDVFVYSRAITDTEVRWLARRQNNLLPSIKILAPENGAQLAGPCNLLIRVDARDQDSGLRLVEYYVNGNFMGSSDTAPYSYEWSGILPQTYTLTAKAIDNENAQASDTIGFSVSYPGDTLIAHWNFNDQSDTTAYDSSPNANHGEIINGRITGGVDGSALFFSGNGAVITKKGLLSSLPAFTLAGWIKPEKTGWRTGLWGQDGVIEFGFIDQDNIQLWTFNGGYLTVKYPFAMQQWHHITITGDGSTIRIFFDAHPAGSYKQQQTPHYGNTPWSFNIAGGGIFDTSGNYFTGAVDEIYVYNQALAEEQIKALMEANSYQRPQIRIIGLTDGSILYYPFQVTPGAEIIRNNCPVNAVEFFINAYRVFTDTEAPYEYTWVMDSVPGLSAAEIMVKFTTSCGTWGEAAITVKLKPGENTATAMDNESSNPGQTPQPGSHEQESGLPGSLHPTGTQPGIMDFSNPGSPRGGNLLGFYNPGNSRDGTQGFTDNSRSRDTVGGDVSLIKNDQAGPLEKNSSTTGNGRATGLISDQNRKNQPGQDELTSQAGDSSANAFSSPGPGNDDKALVTDNPWARLDHNPGERKNPAKTGRQTPLSLLLLIILPIFMLGLTVIFLVKKYGKKIFRKAD